MEFQEVITSRRSIRKYDPEKKVEESLIKELIHAAVLAPSWKNSQTGRYHCVMSESLLDTFKKECLPAFNAQSVKDAPVLIVSTFVKNRSGFERSGEETNELGNGWGIYDLGLQNENLLLKAKELGLDSLVLGIRDAEKIRELLSIPQNEAIVSVIAVGYGAQAAERPKRKTAEDIAVFY